MIQPPLLQVFAGPDGAGKSTLARTLVDGPLLLSAEDIAREMAPSDPRDAALPAAREMIRQIRALTAARASFAAQTTLAGHGSLAWMGAALADGYRVFLYYLGLQDEETAVERVRSRLAATDRPLGEAEIRRRYARSLAHLPRALRMADQAVVLDNSARAGRARLLLTAERGVILHSAPNLPLWLRGPIGTPEIGHRACERSRAAGHTVAL